MRNFSAMSSQEQVTYRRKRKMEKVTSSESTPLMRMVTSHVKNINSIMVPVKSEILEQPESCYFETLSWF
jgi:hypothetical protein